MSWRNWSINQLQHCLALTAKLQVQVGCQTLRRWLRNYCSLLLHLLQARGDLRGRVPDCCSGAALVHVQIRVKGHFSHLPSIVSSTAQKLPRSDQLPALSPRQESPGPVSAKSEMSLIVILIRTAYYSQGPKVCERPTQPLYPVFYT